MNLSRGFLFTLLASVCWAGSIILSRIVLNTGENPYNLTVWTSLLATPYWLVLLSRELPNVRKLIPSDYRLLIVMSLTSSVGVSFAEVFALKHSPAVNFSFLIRTVTVFGIIFAAIFLRERITRKKLVLLVTMMTGVYLLISKGQEIRFTLGDGYTLIEAMLLAFGTVVLAKKATNRMPANTASSMRFLIGLLPILAISLSRAPLGIPQLPVYVLAIAALSTGISFFMFHAFKHATASFVTMIMSFTPVFVTLMAVPILGESLLPVQILGGGLIILSGIFVEKLKI